MPHTAVLPLNYIHLFKLLLIQDSNLDPNIKSIVLYPWANKNYTLLTLV